MRKTAIGIGILILTIGISSYARDVVLQWDQPDDAAVVGYNLYRCVPSGTMQCDWALANNSPIPATADRTQPITYTDTIGDFDRAIYQAKSVDSDGTESTGSNSAVIWPGYVLDSPSGLEILP